jgi:hypothetical protein
LGYSQKSLRDWESDGAEDKVKDQVKDKVDRKHGCTRFGQHALKHWAMGQLIDKK